MIRRALRRAARSYTLFVLLALLFAAGVAGVRSTSALFNGETQNKTSTFAGGWIGAPTALQTPTVSGYDTQLGWTPGTHGPVTGQPLWGVDNSAVSSCSGVTYAQLATMATASTATYTDSNRGSSLGGHWFCYQMVSTSATVWTASAAFSAVQLGLVTTSVAIANGRTAGTLDNGDTIVLTFNQRTNVANGSGTVCTFSGASGTGVILIGDTTCSNSSTDAFSLGKLTGVTIGGAGHQGRNASWTVTTTAPWTITITVTQNGQTVSGTGTFTASTSVKSNATIDQATACTTASICTPTASGGF